MHQLAALPPVLAATDANTVNGVGLVVILIATVGVLVGAVVFFVRRRQ